MTGARGVVLELAPMTIISASHHFLPFNIPPYIRRNIHCGRGHIAKCGPDESKDMLISKPSFHSNRLGR